MLCPVCKNVELAMSERQGIEIDYCPACRGVWLDRGELDKIIERSLGGAPADAGSQARNPNDLIPPAATRYGHDSHHSGHPRDHHGSSHHGQPRSFWKDLFD